MESAFRGQAAGRARRARPDAALLLLDGAGAGLRAASRRWTPPTGQLPRRRPRRSCRPRTTLPTSSTPPARRGSPRASCSRTRTPSSFVDWCSEVFEPRADDRFSSHAPFHFDLSILDSTSRSSTARRSSWSAEDIGKDPERLAALIAEERISIWYSAPSILACWRSSGSSSVTTTRRCGCPVRRRGLPGQAPAGAAAAAGAPVFQPLRADRDERLHLLRGRRRRSPRSARRRSRSARSARICGAGSWISEGRDVPAGDEGELCVSGPRRDAGLLGASGADRAGPSSTTRLASAGTGRATSWSRTPDGNYVYLGRRDRMVKRRGYRVELGEIEAGLYQHPDDQGGGGRRRARRGSRRQAQRVSELPRDAKRPSLIALKRFCAENLPLYMIPDLFSWQRGAAEDLHR